MKRIIIKSFLITLVLLITAGALVSCGDRDYDEQEVAAAAKELIEDSIILNNIYWGEGIAHDGDRNYSNGVYYQAVYSSHYQYGFTTIADLKRITKETFSDGYSDTVFNTVLSGITEENGMLMSRYYQKYILNADNKQIPECIMVNSEWDPILTSDIEYDFESLKVVGSKKETVYVTIECTVKKDTYEPQKTTLEIALIEEEDGWRIDSPTFANYDITKIKN